MTGIFLALVLSGSTVSDCPNGVCKIPSVSRGLSRDVTVHIERHRIGQQRWTPLKNLVQNVRDRRSNVSPQRGCK